MSHILSADIIKSKDVIAREKKKQIFVLNESYNNRTSSNQGISSPTPKLEGFKKPHIKRRLSMQRSLVGGNISTSVFCTMVKII